MKKRGAARIRGVGLVLLLGAVLSVGTVQLYQRLQVKERVHLWLVWGGIDREAITDPDYVTTPLPEGATTLTGVVHYRNGQLRARDARDMPLESVRISASGLVLTVEDAYRSEADDTHRKALPPQTRGRVLLVRIVACNEDDDDRTLAYRYYHFKPGEPIELTLPYEIDIVQSPADAFLTNRIAHRASFGPLYVEGEYDLLCEEEWEEVLEEEGWESYLTYLTKVHVEMSMDNGIAGVRYAYVSTICDGEPLELGELSQRHPMWRMSADEGGLVCEAIATGMMSYAPKWKPKLASASLGEVTRATSPGAAHDPELAIQW